MPCVLLSAYLHCTRCAPHSPPHHLFCFFPFAAFPCSFGWRSSSQTLSPLSPFHSALISALSVPLFRFFRFVFVSSQAFVALPLRFDCHCPYPLLSCST